MGLWALEGLDYAPRRASRAPRASRPRRRVTEREKVSSAHGAVAPTLAASRREQVEGRKGGHGGRHRRAPGGAGALVALVGGEVGAAGPAVGAGRDVLPLAAGEDVGGHLLLLARVVVVPREGGVEGGPA